MDADLAELFRAGLSTWDLVVLDDVARERVQWTERADGTVSYRRWWLLTECTFCTPQIVWLSELGLVGRLDVHAGCGGRVALTERGMLALESAAEWRRQRNTLQRLRHTG